MEGVLGDSFPMLGSIPPIKGSDIAGTSPPLLEARVLPTIVDDQWHGARQ
jgi:hypothetical protein